jgi:hypothetical protein
VDAVGTDESRTAGEIIVVRNVEDKIFRPLVQQFFNAELLAAMMTERGFGVDISLHDLERAIDRRQANLRFRFAEGHNPGLCIGPLVKRAAALPCLKTERRTSARALPQAVHLHSRAR